jgi:hypothetical protein
MMVAGPRVPRGPGTATWVAGLVGLVAALGGLAGASLGLLVHSAPVGFDGQFALALAGYSALLGGGWLALALWRRQSPRWLGGGALGGGLAALALGAYLLALRAPGDAHDPAWLAGALVGPPLLAWGLGLALAARFGRLSRAGALISALGLGPVIVISWVYLLLVLLPALLLPALLVAPLLLSGPGAPRAGAPRATGWLRLGYLALPPALAAGFAAVTLAWG